MTSAETAVAVLRGMHVAAIFSLFGTLLFGELSGSVAEMRALRRLARSSAVVAIVTGCLWLGLNARAMAGAGSLGDTFAAFIAVSRETQFGFWLLIRLALLIAVLPAIPARRIGCVLAAAALVLQPELAHAGAIGGRTGLLLTVSEALHMLAGSAWLGGLMPLAFALSILPPDQSALICRRFSAVALLAVLVLAVTGTIQASVLVGSISELTDAEYGRVLLVKLGFLLCALSLGALNRFHLTSRVAYSGDARVNMRRSLAAEAVFGLAIVLAAAWLASLAPGSTVSQYWLLSAPAASVLAVAGMASAVAVFPLVWRYCS